MPNNIQNRLSAHGDPEEVAAFFDAIKGADGARIDFNAIIPKPASAGDDEWFAWERANWGTKWNAYKTPDPRDMADTIYFQTAWQGVPKLMLALSCKFPRLLIWYCYADEDIGYNVGGRTFWAGVEGHYEFDDASDLAYELALDLHPNYREYYEKVDGKYKHKEG